MNRREFLATTASVALGSVALAEAKPALSFGFSLYGAHAVPLKEAIATVAKIGYTSIEFAPKTDWPIDAAKLTPVARREISKQLIDHKLTLASLLETWPLDGDEKQHQAQLDKIKIQFATRQLQRITHEGHAAFLVRLDYVASQVHV